MLQLYFIFAATTPLHTSPTPKGTVTSTPPASLKTVTSTSPTPTGTVPPTLTAYPGTGALIGVAVGALVLGAAILLSVAR